MNNHNKLIITGATGFTGQHACSHFFKAGYNVTAVTRSTTKKVIEGANTEQCDLTNYDLVKEMIKKIKPNYLLHLAGQNHVGQSWSDPVNTIKANLLTTLYLLEALRNYSPDCKVVIVGSALQFDPSDMTTLTHPYSFSKTLQILLALAWSELYNLHVVIAKPSNLIGPGFSNGVCSIFASKIVEMENEETKKMLEVNNLHSQRDFVDVRDSIKAYEILLNKGNATEIYDISSGKSHTLGEVVTILKELTPIDFQIKTKYRNTDEGKVEIIPQKIVNLGWSPTIPLNSSLEDILSFYREIHKKK
jgi:GDP-4-dehydro-6-deoxy-D-mannose reductase